MDTILTVPVGIIRGHGWKGRTYDPGARGVRNGQEADVTLSVATALADVLPGVVPGVEVIPVRCGGVESAATLTEGCRYLSDQGAKVSLSIHCNAAASASARGHEVWHADRSGYQDKRLARLVNTSLGIHMFTHSIPDRGLKTGKRFIEIVQPQCHACLVELGFLTNAQDAAVLYDYGTHRGIAEAIARSVRDFIYGPSGG